MSKTINLGRVTAYAEAVAAGYTGTREQFANDLANAANYAAEAGDAAETATEAATTASTAAETATTKAEEASADADQAHADAQAILGAKETAVAAANTASSKAGEAANSAQQAAASETAAAGSATTASNAAASATASKNAAATSETNAANSANAAAQTLTNVNQAGATQVAAIQAKGTEVLNSIPADYTELSNDVDDLKSDLENVYDDVSELDIAVNGSHITINYVANQYVSSTDGHFVNYENWTRTDFVPIPTNGALRYSNSGPMSAYCAFYSLPSESAFVSAFTIQNTTSGEITVPNTARYFIVSNYTSAISSFAYLNPPEAKGVKDDIAERLPEALKIVMVDKVVALEGEQFDIHYDNIIANYRASEVQYKEAFGSFLGVGMETLVRLQSNTPGETSGSLRLRFDIPGSFNALQLPTNVARKLFNITTIPKTSGTGLTRKVMLIGDSWTAPGIYANELRNLFSSADEPMDITLLGTLGMGGAYVGPTNGFHEGHGAYSAKTYCTEANYNGYANGFYNPNTNTFDFAYYMTNCGYSGVDDVFINLGINDVATVEDFDDIITYWNTMINSIKSYNSNIRIFIGLCGLPAQYKYGTQENNCNRFKARRLLFHERLIAEYGNRENEGYIIVPLHLSIDNEHDFPSTEMARSFRDSTLVTYCTDYIHPNNIAYYKVADRIRTYIKYAETL